MNRIKITSLFFISTTTFICISGEDIYAKSLSKPTIERNAKIYPTLVVQAKPNHILRDHSANQEQSNNISNLKIRTLTEIGNTRFKSTNWDESLKIYKSILLLRIKTNHRGYENKPDFKLQANSFLQFLSSIKKPKSSAMSDLVIKQGLESLSRKSYKSYISNFLEFYKTHASQDSVLKTVSAQEALDATLAVSYQTYLQDPNYWKQGWRFTWIYPWCMPPNSFDKRFPLEPRIQR